MSDSCCDLNSSFGEAPAPPHMFANSNGSNQPLTEEEAALYMCDDTLEDENGDPYSVV